MVLVLFCINNNKKKTVPCIIWRVEVKCNTIPPPCGQIIAFESIIKRTAITKSPYIFNICLYAVIIHLVVLPYKKTMQRGGIKSY